MTEAGTLEAFRASGHTLGNVEGDFIEWHRGRPFYYCWMVMVDSSAWNSAAREAALRLRRWLLSGYARQSHVTILPGGFPRRGSLDMSAISACVRRILPFRISLGPLGSFTSSPCFEVVDPDAILGRLRSALRPVLRDPLAQVSDASYLPHLTVGLYRDCFSTGGIAAAIESFPPVSVESVIQVDWISLCAYDTSSIKGPLTEVARVELGSGRTNVLGHAELFRNGCDDRTGCRRSP